MKKWMIYGCLTLLFVGIFGMAPWLTPCDPMATDLTQVELAPTALHLFGTDYMGRDVFSRVLLGGQTTIFSALAVLGMAVLVGTVLGLASGYWGGKWDRLFLSVTEIFLSFPGIVLAIAVASMLGGGMTNAIFSLTIIAWPKYARLVRGETKLVREMAFVDVARMSKTPTWKILYRHVFPNVAGTLLTTAVNDFGATMMELAGLSFLGLGAVAPQAEWGAMMAVGIGTLQTAPWVVLAPGLAMLLTILLTNLLGESLRSKI